MKLNYNLVFTKTIFQLIGICCLMNLIVGEIIVIQNHKNNEEQTSTISSTATPVVQLISNLTDSTNETPTTIMHQEPVTSSNSTSTSSSSTTKMQPITNSSTKMFTITIPESTKSDVPPIITNTEENTTIVPVPVPIMTTLKSDDSTGSSTVTISPSTSSSSNATTNTVLNMNTSTNHNIQEKSTTTTSTTSNDDMLIPPANVTPNIGQMNVSKDQNKQITVINGQNNECPSLQDADQLSQTQLVERLTHGCRYDRLERPITFSGDKENRTRLPVRVSARAYIYFMQNLEAHDLQFKIHTLLQLRFVDPRLAFSKVAPNRKQPILGEKSLRERLWVPHIFFANERESEILGTDEKDILTSISPDGTVILSTRIQATLYCWMNLQKFPFDEQHCATILESWMYNTSELVLHWEKKSPITLAPELHLTEYVLLNTWHNETTINADLSDLRHGAFAGNYSSLSFTVHLAREMGFYLMDYFLPSMMIVAISWVSFWLQADQSAPRIMLGTSTMLTFITLASAQGKTLPKVSYIKVSEVWFLGCTGFIFGSLVEFAFVNTIWRRKKNVELKKVNSKYILKSTLTPRPARKDLGLQKSRSCSSLDNGSTTTMNLQNNANNNSYNNYLTVHSFPTKNTLPIIKTESVDEFVSENGHVNINIDQLNHSANNLCSQSCMDNNNNNNNSNNGHGWTTMTPQQISMWIDRRARFIFPISFIIFNGFFWTFVYVL